MDTSKEFIEMCSKAMEIQSLAPDPGWDSDEEIGCASFFYLPIDGKVEILKWDNDEARFMIGGYGGDDSDSTWLPRQDQLQAMSGLSWEEYDDKCFSIAVEFHGDDYCDKIAEAVPKEQAGLMVVMKGKFGKRWDGKVWVASNTK